MNPMTRKMLAVTLMAGVASASAADVASSRFESKFYKDFPLFSTFPVETDVRTPIEHFGPVGIGINLLLPPFQMQVSRLEKGSPAEATGKLKVEPELFFRARPGSAAHFAELIGQEQLKPGDFECVQAKRSAKNQWQSDISDN